MKSLVHQANEKLIRRSLISLVPRSSDDSLGIAFGLRASSDDGWEECVKSYVPQANEKLIRRSLISLVPRSSDDNNFKLSCLERAQRTKLGIFDVLIGSQLKTAR